MVGVLLGDPGRLTALSANLSATFPPLAGFFDQALAGFVKGAVTYSLVGLLALVWGASQFYQSLDDAMARIFESTRRRDPLRRGLFGVLSVLLLAAVVGGVIAASHLVANLAGTGPPIVAAGASLLSSGIGGWLASVVLFSGGIALAYRLVPTNRPEWRIIAMPSIAVATFTALFTAAFTALAPQLVGSLQVYGAFVAVFAAMIWLSFVSQALLIGAAWVHRRAVVDGSTVARGGG